VDNIRTEIQQTEEYIFIPDLTPACNLAQ